MIRRDRVLTLTHGLGGRGARPVTPTSPWGLPPPTGEAAS